MIPRIILTAGEPAGIGPDIIVNIAQLVWAAELIVISDPDLFLTRAKQLRLPLELIVSDFNLPAQLHQPGTLKIIPLKLNVPCEAGKLNPDNALPVLTSLALAANYCLEHKAQALVTGPIHKATLNTAGISFTGHTEFLAQHCHAKQALMLFIVDKIKVALATTHIPLAKISENITVEHLSNTLRLLHHELKTLFSQPHPHIFVCGLNPHAGESGHLGREEIEIITPALNLLRNEKIHITGPLPADTIFTEKYLKSADAILAMYHDQALPVIKYMGFDRAVNITLGLPIIRTSVDHGTAVDLAGTGQANPTSLKEAIYLAIQIANRP
ncbi:MAG: pdxA [Gammaproteobacteria bacterium]|jgi:4-hydroxythreonine-4-phosphate dehydrogenase|nr:pdxA [Gammaproteobacteria bacterium]